MRRVKRKLFDEIAKREFMAKVAVKGPEECWLWMGHKTRNGYGIFSCDGKNIRASRAALAWKVGRRIDRHEHACHRCDNPICVNPEHLFLGDSLTNRLDCCQKNRQCKGVDHHSAKLTAAKVRRIRTCKESNTELARRFGVTQAAVGKVRRGVSWKHVR